MMQATAVTRIEVIGGLRLIALGASGAVVPRARKTRAVLGYLALSPGRRAERSPLAGMLWQSGGEAQARASLRQALRELAACNPADDGWLVARRDHVALGPVAIDIADLRAEVAGPHDRVVPLLTGGGAEKVLAGLDGITPDFDGWLHGARAALAEELAATLRRAIGEARDAAGRAALTERLLLLNPADEAALRQHMAALADSGQPAAALLAHERFRKDVHRLLDTRPSAATEALAGAIRALRPPPQTAPARHADATLVARSGIVRVQSFIELGGDVATMTGVVLADELAGSLARFRRLRVVRAETSMVGPGDAADFTITGAVAAEADGCVLTLRLLDADVPPRVLWSERKAISGRNPLRMADQLAGVAGTLQSVLMFHLDKVLLLSENVASPAGLVARGIARMSRMTQPAMREAMSCFAEAMRIEPGHPRAAAWRALGHLFTVGQYWSVSRQDDINAARSLSEEALSGDPFDAEALAIAGHVSAFLAKDHELALDFHRRALALNPHLMTVWALLGLGLSYVGRPAEAVAQFERYVAEARAEPMFNVLGGCATIPLMLKRDYARAVAVGRRFVLALPGFTSTYKPLLVACGHLGLREEASAHLAALLRSEPDYSVERSISFRTYAHDHDNQHAADGLMRAGVPRLAGAGAPS